MLKILKEILDIHQDHKFEHAYVRVAESEIFVKKILYESILRTYFSRFIWNESKIKFIKIILGVLIQNWNIWFHLKQITADKYNTLWYDCYEYLYENYK